MRDAARATDLPTVPERSRDTFSQLATDVAVSAFLGDSLDEETRTLLARPWVYGLGLAGQAGVEHVLRCFLADLDLQLGLSGHGSPSGRRQGRRLVSGKNGVGGPSARKSKHTR